jgi:hypothetical protein
MIIRILLFIVLFLLPLILTAQSDQSSTSYEVSDEFPYGKMNPEAPPQTADYAAMIGLCDCKSESRNPDGTWADTIAMTWKWKYIMNGMAVQDETLKDDAKHSGSIRQYSKDSARWYVHYYSSSFISTTLSTWEGNKQGNDIILYREQKAPNGMEGFYRLTFSNISEKGYDWIGEWVDKTEKIVYPTWKIQCLKREDQ